MARQYTLAFPLSPDATLPNYVGEAGAKLAELQSWNLIYGVSGSGKSHLMQAICRDESLDDIGAGNALPGPSIYLAELSRLEPEVLKDLESFALICIDDVDQILGDKAWEEALFHLLNGCKDLNSKVLLGVSQPVALLPVQLADLKSRLSAAYAIETDTLADEQRIEVMQRRARHWGFDLPYEVGEFILRRSPRGMVALMDNLKRLELETLRAHRKVTIPFAKQTLQL